MALAIKINSGSSPSFMSVTTLDKALLNYASIGENSNKYYRIELQKGTDSSDYPFRVYTEYGRVGKTCVQEGRYFLSRYAAERCYEEIIEKKTAKGYSLVALEDDPRAVRNIKMPKVDLSPIKDEIHLLVGKFYQEATGFVTKAVETPLGKISAHQVARGSQILNDIERNLDKRFADFEYLSNQFYTVIPVIFGARVDRDKMTINTYEKVLEKREMLDVMLSVASSLQDITATIEEKYKSLGAVIRKAEPAEAQRIAKSIQNTRGNHRFKMDVLNVYEVTSMENCEPFNPCRVKTMELFHGSRNCNMLGIMQRGLQIKPSAAVHTGSMFGSGIYFADKSTKSANYCWGFGSADQVLDTNFLLVCEVATGKIKEYEDAQMHLTSAPKGYNSVKGTKGSTLEHNEYIVYHANQARIKYIVEFKRH